MTRASNSPSTKLFLLMLSIGIISACSKESFSPPPANIEKSTVETPFSQESFFVYRPAQDFFKQDQYDRNETSLVFQILDGQGFSVPSLGSANLTVFEDAQIISDFELQSQNGTVDQKADIVFILDTTSSMSFALSSLKAKVRGFVDQMKQRKVDPRLCLVTFKDKVEKKCSSLVEDNPQTSTNENLEKFLEELSRLKATQGGDKEDNSLKAIMEAAKTPWRVGAQRVAVLMTDTGFHYLPDRKGDAGNETPFYGDAMSALTQTGMTLFAMAPVKEGYDRPFQGNPSLVELSHGQFFNWSEFLSGSCSFERISSAIATRVSSRYVLKYVVEDNQLDPTIPLSRKSFKIQVPGHVDYRLQILQASSTQPMGRPEYKKSFHLSRKPRLQNKHLSAVVNGETWSGNIILQREDVIFAEAPPADADIEIFYDPVALREGLTMRPLILPQDLDVTTMSVHYNGKEVPMEELRLSRDFDGNLVLDPFFTVASEEDPYRILDRAGLDILVEGVVLTKEP